jgi:hypothetical protein
MIKMFQQLLHPVQPVGSDGILLILLEVHE